MHLTNSTENLEKSELLVFSFTSPPIANTKTRPGKHNIITYTITIKYKARARYQNGGLRAIILLQTSEMVNDNDNKNYYY